MVFSVIYSVEAIPGGMKEWMVPKAEPWVITESWDHDPTDPDADDDDQFDHRKACALLTKDEFISFVNRMCMTFDDTPTMGMIGAPGFGFGHVPAMSFSSEFYDHYDGLHAWANMYVCPIPHAKTADDLGTLEDGDFTEKDWDRIRKVLCYMFR